jgi:act minimal PKS acyl carrier protein
MPDKDFGIDDLRRILRQNAGVDPDVDLDGEILDTTFEDLGYDSIALLEAASVITREYRVPIDDDALLVEITPRDLITIVNTA